MRLPTFTCALALAALSGTALAAPLTYEADLPTPSGTVAGQVGGFGWFLDDGSGVDFVRFFAHAGMTVTLGGERLHANLDPALSVYRGTTNADPAGFLSQDDWGGLTFLFSLDDENPPATGIGSFGDPFGRFAVTEDGYYTVALGGGSGSTDGEQYGYRLTVSFVPEPAAAVLAMLGLAGAALPRRRTKAIAGS